MHLSSIYHVLHYACCPLLLLIKFPLAMLTCCAGKRTEKCSVHVITQNSVGWVMTCWHDFFSSSLEERGTPCDSVSFPAHFWLPLCRLAGWDVANAKKETAMKRWKKWTFELKSNIFKYISVYTIDVLRTNAWGSLGWNRLLASVTLYLTFINMQLMFQILNKCISKQ